MIPIPEASKKQQEDIESIVKNILSHKHSVPTANTSDLEYQIDKLVYRLYNLTEDEIAVIEQ